MESIFLGQKELFNGLAIANSGYVFSSYPVIKLEFSARKVETADDFAQLIVSATNNYVSANNIHLVEQSFELRFRELVSALCKKTSTTVVLLIDEYDKPILDCLEKPTLSEIKGAINGFYAMVKTLDQYLRFTSITGVSKFSKVSVFSGMNNLVDLRKCMKSSLVEHLGVTSR